MAKSNVNKATAIAAQSKELLVDLSEVEVLEAEQVVEANAKEVTDISPKGWGEVDTTSDQQSMVEEPFVPPTVTGVPPVVSFVSPELAAYLQSLPTKSARIRHMNALGFRRAQIASHLDILYQHVRNVLTQQVKRPIGHDVVNTAAGTTTANNVEQLVVKQELPAIEEMAISEASYEPEMRLMG